MTLKELLNIAKAQLGDLANFDNPDFRLEQAEFSESENQWDIVVSFLIDNVNKPASGIIFPQFQYQRIYKRLKIKENGTVVGFYIYNNKE